MAGFPEGPSSDGPGTALGVLAAPSLNGHAPAAVSLDELTRRLTLEQKVRLISGATTWRTATEPAIGLRPMTFSDGPAGVRGGAWDERVTSLLLPCPTAVAAMWSDATAVRLGALLAAEARRKGVHVVLGPNLNLHRSPLGGRHFECYSEDPLLTARTGAAVVRGVQSGGVAATAKHYVANDSETERLTVDVRVSVRVLRELYLVPFEAAVEAGAAVVMSGYNGVNGSPLTENALLAAPLKEEWGFDGVVVSDWGAVRSTASAAAAQDLAMPGPEPAWGPALIDAVRSGDIPEALLDEKVRRLLLLAARTGALDGAPVPPSAEPGNEPELLREAAARGTVLLRNTGVLPLDAARLRTVAVIGRHAVAPRLQGGGSAEVFPEATPSFLGALRDRLAPGTTVTYSPGPSLDAPPEPLVPGPARDPRSGLPGVLVRMLDDGGRELYAEHRLSGRILEPRLVPRSHTVEISALFEPDRDGLWTFGVAGFGRMSLTAGREVLVDGEFARETDDPIAVHVHPPRHTGGVRLVAGRPVLVTARRSLAPDTGRAVVLSALAPEPVGPETAIADAVEAAVRADAVVLVVGTTEQSESEGRDRGSLVLPGHQDVLAQAVLRARPDAVVVVNSGGPVEMPWRDSAGALVLGWFPGQEGGPALADVLLGLSEPGGRLPTTWPAALADAPVHEVVPEDGVLDYAEGLHIGHRAWLRSGARPAYWFGHGLGYTTWSYESMDAPASVSGAAPVTVRVRVRNTGDRAGREVVQVYVARPGSVLDRPVRTLAGYAEVTADPGEAVVAEVSIEPRVWRHWAEVADRWAVEAGRAVLFAARSVADPLLECAVRVTPAEDR